MADLATVLTTAENVRSRRSPTVWSPLEYACHVRDAAALFTNVLYRYPEPKERTLHWLATHTLHEVQHHVVDVRRQLPQSPEQPQR